MARPGEQLDGLVEDPGRLDAVGHRPEETARNDRVDGVGLHRLDRSAGVEQAHHLQRGPRMGLVELAQQVGRGEPGADHVDPQRAAAGPYRGGGPFPSSQQIPGRRQKGLASGGEADTTGGPGEQRHPEFLFQRGHSLGGGLLGDGQGRGGRGELARIGDRDERAHGVQVHGGRP